MAKDITQRLVVKGKDNSKGAFKSANASLSQLQSGATRALGSLGALVGVAGFGALIKQSFAAADNIGKMADRLNASTKGLVALHHAGQLAGASIEGVDKSIEKMVRSIGDALVNNTATQVRAFEKLGLSLDEIADMNADEQFERIANGIRGLSNQSEKAAVAAAIFGRSGIQMLNTIEQTGEAMAEAREEVQLFGLALSRDAIKEIEEANDNMFRLGQVAKGVGTQLALELAPHISAAAEAVADFVKEAGGIEKIISNTLGNLRDSWEEIELAVKSAAAYIGGKALFGALLGVKGLIVGATGATTAWNIALRANPIIMAASILIAGIYGVGNAVDYVKERMNEGKTEVDLLTAEMEGYQAVIDKVNEGGLAAESLISSGVYDEAVAKIDELKTKIVGLDTAMHAAFGDLDNQQNTKSDLTPEEDEETKEKNPFGLSDESLELYKEALENARLAHLDFLDKMAQDKLNADVARQVAEDEARIKKDEYAQAEADRRGEMLEEETAEIALALAARDQLYMSHEETRRKNSETMTKLRLAKEEQLMKTNREFIEKNLKGALATTAKHSKAAFEINKAVKIGEAIQNTYSAATGAYSAMAGIPVVGPALGIAAAASAVAFGLAQVNAIRSSSYGGGGGGGGASGGGSAPSIPTSGAVQNDNTQTFLPGSESREQQRVINIQVDNGGLYNAESIQKIIQGIDEETDGALRLHTRFV